MVGKFLVAVPRIIQQANNQKHGLTNFFGAEDSLCTDSTTQSIYRSPPPCVMDGASFGEKGRSEMDYLGLVRD